MAKWHWRVPLIDALRRPGARGAALADEPEALVTAEAQGAAQLGARQTVHRAVGWAVRGAAVGGCENRNEGLSTTIDLVH